MLGKLIVENFNKTIKDQEAWNFNIEKDGVYLISISARCKNWLQNLRRLFNDDDLALQIDDYLFAEIKGKKREFSNAGSWNGNELKNRSKDVFIVLPLKKGIHTIKFWAGEQPFLEKIEIYKIDLGEVNITKSDFGIWGQSLDILIKNLIIDDLLISASARKKDKLGLRIDGQIQENLKYKKYCKWYWYGQELKGDIKEYHLSQCWTDDLHSLEFYSQGQPQIELIKMKIGSERLKYKVGRVKLYKDIDSSDYCYLRFSASREGKILTKLRNNDRLEIISIRE